MSGRAGPARDAGVVRAAARRLPAGVRRRVRALRERRGSASRRTPEPVSVVVVVERVDLPRLGECLDSVGAQSAAGSGVALEVLLCPAGEDAATWADDPRWTAATGPGPHGPTRVLPACPTWQEAATAGASAATGPWATFLRGCDRLRPGALGALRQAIREGNAALATGRLEQTGQAEPWLERAQARAHARPGSAPVAERPELAGALTPGGLLLRADLCVGRRLPADGDDWLLAPSLARLLAELAGSGVRVAVLDRPTYTYAHDHGTRDYGATPNPLPGLGDWRRRATAAAEALGSTPLERGWRQHVADVELPRLLTEAERATPAQWAELVELARLSAQAGTGVTGLTGVRAGSRALLHLASAGHRAQVEALAVDLRRLGPDVPTCVDDGEVLARWPSEGPELPREVLRLEPEETALRVHVARRAGTGTGAGTGAGAGTVLDLFLAVDQVDLEGASCVVEVAEATSVEPLPGAVAEATRWAGRRFASAVAVRAHLAGAPDVVDVTLRALGLSREARVRVPAPPPAPDSAVRLHDLTLDDGALVVHGTGPLERLRLLDDAERPVSVPTSVRGDGALALELRTDLFGRPTWLPPGPYRLVTGDGNVALTEDLRSRLPADLLGIRHRVRPHLGPRGGLVLGLAPPLADDEAGPRQQQRLQAAYALQERPVDPALCYFETYAGRSATDSPLAIFAELRRRRPGLRARWGVADSGQHVPDGAEPVLLRSAEWYDVLARAGVLVVNTDVEPWFSRRPGQLLLQTFHGYPSKAMGLAQWRAKDYPPSVVREFRARGVDTWSVILTPSPEMTRHYREQYAYRGPVLEHGYPRDDALVDPDADEQRARTRRLLGIRDDQVAVLYAPTWRDHLATRPRAAAMTEHLDADRAADAWGESHVLLLRGHRFHTPRAGSRVLDVTRHPEVNDLVLASDAAVLDYSSLRFDYALTGRPMVFLVPDLEEYDAGSRSFLFPFAPTAPGPFVRDTDEVVAALRDPGALATAYAARLAAFNATYNRWQDGHASRRVVDGLLELAPGLLPDR